VKGKESIKDHIIFFKTNVTASWENFYSRAILDYTGSYFRVCYQIVKLIDTSYILNVNVNNKEKSYSDDQKKYFDIFRSTFTQYELEAFFFNCLSKYGSGKFKNLIEKYGLFEPLLIDTDRSNENIHRLTRYAYQYKSKIFEQEEGWKDYFSEIKSLEVMINSKILENSISFLVKMEILQKINLYGINRTLDKYCIYKLKYNSFDDINHALKYKIEYFKIEIVKNLDILSKLAKHIKNNKCELALWMNKGDPEFFNKSKMLSEVLTYYRSTYKDISDKNSRMRGLIAQYEKFRYLGIILTLVKYGISYAEYSEFRRNQ
jgi:hypothetical protein